MRYPLARLEPYCGYWQKEETVALKRTPTFSLRGSLSGKRVDGEVASTGGDDRQKTSVGGDRKVAEGQAAQ
jgi:hypothetical protein